MVPSGELHITAVDYKHTHHPYFCIVKHLNSGNSQESLPFHLTLRGKKGCLKETVTHLIQLRDIFRFEKLIAIYL